MLNKKDVQTLRAQGTSNAEILKMIGRVVPSAAKAYADMEADQRTPGAAKEQVIGKMLDELTPDGTASGLPYLNAVSLSSAQKSYDSLEKQYQAVEKQDQPVDDGFTIGGVVKGVGQNLKGLAKAALGVPMVATYHLFKTADDLAALLSGTEPTQLRPDQKTFVKDLHREAYKDLPTAAMLYTGAAGMSAVGVGLTAGGLASGQRALAKAGVAPEGMPTGRDVSLMSIPYEGAKKFVDGYTTFTGPLKSVVAKNTIYNAAQQVLDGMVYDTPDKSMGQLIEDSLAGGLTAGFIYKGSQKFQSATAVKKFILGEPAVPKDGGAPPPDGGTPPPDGGAPPKVEPDGGAPIKAAPGAEFNPDRPASVMQGAVEQLTGLRPGTQEAAADPQMRGMVDDFRAGKASPHKVVLEDLEGAFSKTMKEVSDTGAEYNFIRGSKQSMFMPADAIQSVLNKYGFEYKPGDAATADPVTGLLTKKGQLNQSETSKPISGAQFEHLQRALHLVGSPDIAVNPQMFRTAKGLLQDLGKFYDPQLPGGGGEVRAMAGELLGKLEAARRGADAPSDFKKYAELDDRYSPLRKEYDALKDEFFELDEVTGGLRFKDNAPAKIMSAMKGKKFNLLERLERASPGITKKIQAYEAYRNIVDQNVPGQYVRAGAKVASAALFGSAAGLPGALAGGIVGVLASSPTVMWSALTQFSKMKESGKGWTPLGIITKAENGAPFTPAEADAVRGVVKVITEDYAMPQQPRQANPEMEARQIELKGGKRGTPGIDYAAEPPKVDNLDDVPLSEFSPKGKADADAAQKILDNGGSIDEAAKVDTDPLASPRADRHNEDATSPNKMEYMGIEDTVKEALDYWKSNGDPDAIANALEDPEAAKAVPKELVKRFKEYGQDMDDAQDIADYLETYVKTRDRAAARDLKGLKNIGDGFAEQFAKFRGEKGARELIDNFTEGFLEKNKLKGADLEKAYIKALQTLGKNIRTSRIMYGEPVDGINEDGWITIDPKKHPELFKFALQQITKDNKKK